MKRIMGGWLAALSRIMVVEGGRVDVRQLRDDEGVSLVYDLSTIAAGQFLAADARSVNQDNIDDVGTVIQVGSLPRTCVVRGIDVTVTSVANVQEITIYAALWGVIASAATNQDYILWSWRAGDASVTKPGGGNITIGDGTGTVFLIPSIDRVNNGGPFVYQDTQNQLGRQAIFDIAFFCEATAAVTFDLSASLYLYFYRDPEPGPGQGTISLSPPPSLGSCPRRSVYPVGTPARSQAAGSCART